MGLSLGEGGGKSRGEAGEGGVGGMQGEGLFLGGNLHLRNYGFEFKCGLEN